MAKPICLKSPCIVFSHKTTKRAVCHAHPKLLLRTNCKADWKVNFSVLLMKETFLSDRHMNLTCLVFPRSKLVVSRLKEMKISEIFTSGILFWLI